MIYEDITQTIGRSLKHRLFLATYGGLGAALCVIQLASPHPDLLALPLILSFILVSGLRAAFNFPAELSANWTFRIAEADHTREALRAMRKWMLSCAIVPLFVLLAPLEFQRFPPNQALFHIAFGLTLSLLLMDVMFWGFRKVPFTCSYFPGKVNLVGLSAIYVFGFTTYSATMAGVEAQLQQMPLAAAVFFAVAIVVHLVLRWTRDHLMGRAARLEYDAANDPVVRTLDLASR